jgi:hypothetical protein
MADLSIKSYGFNTRLDQYTVQSSLSDGYADIRLELILKNYPDITSDPWTVKIYIDVSLTYTTNSLSASGLTSIRTDIKERYGEQTANEICQALADMVIYTEPAFL